MKEKVLSNIINYVTTNNITISILECLSDVEETEFGFTSLDPVLIWEELKSEMKFDSISIYLLKNFKNAIETENYIGLSYMKKEILNNWDLREDDFLRIGKNYLTILKDGVKNSELLKDQEGFIGDLLYTWENRGFVDYKYVLKGLTEFKSYIDTYYPRQPLTDEVVDFIKSTSDVKHPLINIDKIVEYFKLIEN